MTIEINRVQRMRLNTESSFCADGSATLANYVDVPFVEGSCTALLDREMLNPEYAQQHKYGYPTQLTGLRSCSLTFAVNLAGTGVAAGSATTAVQSPLGEILAAVMGGETLGVGSSVASGGAVTGFVAGSATGLAQGTFAGMLTDNAAVNYEVRPIKTVSGSTVTLRLNYSEAPDTSDIIYSGATYYLTQDPQSSLQVILEGYEQTDRWLLRGLQLESMGLELPIGQLPRMTFTLKGVLWDQGDGTGGVLTGSALGVASYARTSPTHVSGSLFYQTASTVTLPTATAASALVYNPHLSYIPQTSASAQSTDTIARWVADRVAPVMDGSFTVPFEDFSYFDDRDNKTLKQVFLQIGNTQGSTVVIDIPQAQIVNVTRDGGDGIASQTVLWAAQVDDQTSGTGDRSDSPFRIGLW